LYYIYGTYNHFENLKKVLHELPQNEGKNSHFQLVKMWFQMKCVEKNLINLIDNIALT